MTHPDLAELTSADDERVVDLSDEEPAILFDDEPVLPASTRDDTDAGWGEHHTGNDDRLWGERPPHWD